MIGHAALPSERDRPHLPGMKPEQELFAVRVCNSGVCGVPSERRDYVSLYPGFHPGLVCGAPLGRRNKAHFSILGFHCGLVCCASSGRRDDLSFPILGFHYWLVCCAPSWRGNDLSFLNILHPGRRQRNQCGNSFAPKGQCIPARGKTPGHE